MTLRQIQEAVDQLPPEEFSNFRRWFRERDAKRRDREMHARRPRRLSDELDKIALHCSRLPVRDARPADEILGYGDDGLPR